MQHMKQSYHNIQATHKWNLDRSLHKSHSPLLESTMLLEEVLEGLGIVEAKTQAKLIIKTLPIQPVSEVDWLDHLCDLEFILHGSKCKLGLTPEQDADSFQCIVNANQSKPTATDPDGKVTKPSTFVGPESKLEHILSKRVPIQ